MDTNYKVGDWVRIWGDGDEIHRIHHVFADGVGVNGENKGFDSLRRVSDAELRELAKQARSNAVALVAEADEIDAYLAMRTS